MATETNSKPHTATLSRNDTPSDPTGGRTPVLLIQAPEQHALRLSSFGSKRVSKRDYRAQRDSGPHAAQSINVLGLVDGVLLPQEGHDEICAGEEG